MNTQPHKHRIDRLLIFRVIQWLFVLDMAIGVGLNYFAAEIAGDDDDFAGALYLVGIGLAFFGAIGFLMFAALARGARRRG